MNPERIGRYEIAARIGQGAMGEVFRARDPLLARDVAVKRISSPLEGDVLRARFEREAQSAAKLSHPNIVTVYELGIEGDQLFIAMELLDGVDLKHVIVDPDATLDGKLDLFAQVCDGLAYAHAHQVVHRDLKPANIHVLPGGKVKIMDFGLARLAGSEMTATGVVLGTPHYMSPEQVRGMRADPRSDVFALGCVCYELLTGRKPFEAESMHAVLYKVMQEEPVPARELLPGTPEVLQQFLEKALAKTPDERFENAGEMRNALRRVREAIASGRGGDSLPELRRARARPEPPPDEGRTGLDGRAPGRARSVRRMLVAAAALALLVAGVWALRARPPAAAVRTAEVAGLARAVVKARTELARRRLDAGEFGDAVRQADRALEIDPSYRAARQVRDEASAVLARIARASAALRAARGDPEALAAAAFELMAIDPARPEAANAALRAGPAFRPLVEEARRRMRDARLASSAAGADGDPAFAQGIAMAEQGDEAARAGQAPAAARQYLAARLQFDRARRLATER